MTQFLLIIDSQKASDKYSPFCIVLVTVKHIIHTLIVREPLSRLSISGWPVRWEFHISTWIEHIYQLTFVIMWYKDPHCDYISNEYILSLTKTIILIHFFMVWIVNCALIFKICASAVLLWADRLHRNDHMLITVNTDKLNTYFINDVSVRSDCRKSHIY